MNRALMDGPGDDLHRVGVRAVAADDFDLSIAGQQHGVPVEHRLVGQWRREVPVQVDHHLRDAALGGGHPRRLGAQSELLAQG